MNRRNYRSLVFQKIFDSPDELIKLLFALQPTAKYRTARIRTIRNRYLIPRQENS